ncbi:DUF4123 domain-containing protein [Vibrio campbellii]|uniref:DUF4123 domain-containing protein n=1 Tax=Vibrio campbellii TaxID=680 RepID=UPI00398A419F
MSNTQLNPNWRIQGNAQPNLITNQQAYVIIEPLLWPEWKKKLEAHLEPFEVIPLMAGTRLSHLNEGPVLVSIGSSEEALQACVAKMSQTPCGCLVWSSPSHSSSEVAASLRQRLFVSRNQGEALFRFYEPRTLVPLMAALSDEERRQMFPLLSSLHWHSKQWLSINLSHASEATTSIQPWTLSQEQLSTMQNIAQQW